MNNMSPVSGGSERKAVPPLSKHIPFCRMIPNIITAFRIAAALAIIPIRTYSPLFYIVYLVAGVSDIADGIIARAFKLQTDLGAKLDSAADLVFWIVVCGKVLPVAVPHITWVGVSLLSAVLTLRLVNYAVALIKTRRFPSLHTKLNKLTGVGLFVAVLLIGSGKVPVAPVWDALCVIALAAVIHELSIHIRMKN